MEARATIQRKSLSQIELEKELKAKEDAVMAEMKVRFKPVPIRSTTERRYEALLEKMEAIRIENHEAAAAFKANEKPFTGMMRRKNKEQNEQKRRQRELAAEQKKKAEAEAKKKARKLKMQNKLLVQYVLLN